MTPGYKTTEFFMTSVFALSMLLGAVADVLPPKWAIVASAGAIFAYNISRGLKKMLEALPPPPVPGPQTVIVQPQESVPSPVPGTGVAPPPPPVASAPPLMQPPGMGGGPPSTGRVGNG